jgi:hypothetical protein
MLPVEHAVALFHERQLERYEAKLETGVRKKRKVMQKAEWSRERKRVSRAEYIAAHTAHEPEELPL